MSPMPSMSFVRSAVRRLRRQDSVNFAPHPERTPSDWDLTVDSDGRLRLHDVDLASLLVHHGSPLQVVDGPALDARAVAALGPYRDGTGIDVSSSYKTNPIPAVLDRLHRHGVGAEAISAYEVWLALELGVSPDRIIYNGPAKSDESLRSAADLGIGLVNANSMYDLTRMEHAAREAGRPMRAGIRVSMAHMWGGQFGIESHAPELTDAIEFARSSSHLELLGLHVHSGFALRTVADYQRHLDAVVDCCERIRANTGWSPDIIDLGGSLACASDLLDSGEPVLQIATASTMALTTLHAAARRAALPIPEIVCEPGRALTADTQLLLASVLDVRNNGSVVEAMLDIGVELAEPLASGHRQIFVANRAGRDDSEVTHRLLGPQPTRRDVLVESCRLPRLSPGDVIAVMDTGAYFVPFSTAGSHPRPAIVMIDPARDHPVELIRDREGTEHRQALDRPSVDQPSVDRR